MRIFSMLVAVATVVVIVLSICVATLVIMVRANRSIVENAVIAFLINGVIAVGIIYALGTYFEFTVMMTVILDMILITAMTAMSIIGACMIAMGGAVHNRSGG